MRLYVDRWLDDERIRGAGDDGQREGGLTLEQEAVYLRLCLTQFRSDDGYLPNRRALLCDSVGCPVGSYETLIAPVIAEFFKKSKDGKKLFNLRVRSEWEQSHSKRRQAIEAAELSWKSEKRRLSLSIADADANARADADASAACERETERESKREIENKREKQAPEVSLALVPTVPAPPVGRQRPEMDLAEETAARYVAAINATFGRSLRTSPKVVTRIRERLREQYKPWHIIALPIMVDAQGLRQDMRRGIDALVFLRDGKHPRTGADGRTYGATDWLERALGRLDQTFLDDRQAAIADQFTVLAPLMESGAAVRKASGL